MSRRRDREALDALIAAGVTPSKLVGSEGLALTQGKRRFRLVSDDGAVTKQGRYWEQKTGERLPTASFLQQKAERDGGVETIRLREGSRGVTRRWNEARGDWDFTRLGTKSTRRSGETTWSPCP
jgi:hypothetical protein